MREEWQEDLPSLEVPSFPTAVRIAGVIWIVFGGLFLLNAALNLLLSMGRQGQEGPQVAGGLCGMVLGMLFGAVFIHVGVQSIRGTAVDTLGNAIGSIAFGLLVGGLGTLGVISTLALGGQEKTVILLIVGAVNLLVALGLLTAGVLALMGRAQYRIWRRASKPRISRDG